MKNKRPTNTKNLHVKKIKSGFYIEIKLNLKLQKCKTSEHGSQNPELQAGQCRFEPLDIAVSMRNEALGNGYGSSFPGELFLEAQFCVVDFVEISC